MNRILVPYDFSNIAEKALDQAISIAKLANSTIYLLHVVNTAGDFQKHQKKLDEFKESLNMIHSGVHFKGVERLGNIFEDIPKVIIENRINLVIMGTHGKQGIQKFMGSYAIKVINDSQASFIVIQDEDKIVYDIKRMVVPIDTTKHTLQKLYKAGEIAKLYGSEIEIVSYSENDEFLRNTIHRNVKFAKKYFDALSIQHKSILLPEGRHRFRKRLMSYAEGADADLIVVMNYTPNYLIQFRQRTMMEEIIMNEGNIPVLAVRDMPKEILGGFRAMAAA